MAMNCNNFGRLNYVLLKPSDNSRLKISIHVCINPIFQIIRTFQQSYNEKCELRPILLELTVIEKWRISRSAI